MKKLYKIHPYEKDSRLDKWLKRNFLLLTQSFIEKNLRKGLIKVNSNKVKAKYQLKLGDQVTILDFSNEKYKNVNQKKSKKIVPVILKKKFNSSIIYQDNNFIIINKWSGIATQGGSKINISIDDIIKNISKNYNLVHRLDKDTAGLLIVAKNLKYTKIFSELFKKGNIKKKYLALCQGIPTKTESEINILINKKNKTKDSKTFYKVLNSKENLSLILFTPVTGKTHQIRIVSRKIGCPIIGDKKYNLNDKFQSEKLKLISLFISFNAEEKDYNFISELPLDFKNFLKNYYFPINFKKIKKILNIF